MHHQIYRTSSFGGRVFPVMTAIISVDKGVVTVRPRSRSISRLQMVTAHAERFSSAALCPGSSSLQGIMFDTGCVLCNNNDRCIANTYTFQGAAFSGAGSTSVSYRPHT